MIQHLLYFAYGEHMSSATMVRHVSQATPIGRGRLPGWTLVVNHMGADGSAKANLLRDADGEAWGVIYRLPASSLESLDTVLLGYTRTELDVMNDAGAAQPCVAHCSELTDEGWLAFDAYRDELVAGAREHSLPDGYVAQLETLATKPGRLPGCGCS